MGEGLGGRNGYFIQKTIEQPLTQTDETNADLLPHKLGQHLAHRRADCRSHGCYFVFVVVFFLRVCVRALMKEEEEETNYPEGYGRKVVVVVCTVSCVVCLRILLNVLSSQCSLPTPLPHRPKNTKRSLNAHRKPQENPPLSPSFFFFFLFFRGGIRRVWKRGRERGRKEVG